MRKVSEESEAKRQAAIKAAEKQKPDPVVRKPESVQRPKLVKLEGANRRKLVPKREKVIEENRKPRGTYMSLWEIVKGYPSSTRTSVKGQAHERDYTLITRHFYPDKFIIGMKIPKDVQVKLVPTNPDISEHWEIRLGDGFAYIDSKLKPIPGEWVYGQIEIKVKLVNKPNQGKRAVYSYLNMYPTENGQMPDHEVVFDSNTDTTTSGLHIGPCSGANRTFLHLYPLEDAE